MTTPGHGADVRAVDGAVGNAKRLQRIIRRWPLLLGGMLIAVAATWWGHQREVPSYSATTTVFVAPLPQWDETFLGTDLVRDSGDATRTATTLAAELKSRRYATAAARELGGDWTADKVAAGINVAAADQINIINIIGRADDPDAAKRLASGFAEAMMTARWETISSQLEARIDTLGRSTLALLGDQQGANSAASVEAARLRTLGVVRDSRADPTLRIDSTSSPVADAQMSLPIAFVLAALGGLFIGVLASAAVETLRRPRAMRSHELVENSAQKPRANGAVSTNGRSPADVK